MAKLKSTLIVVDDEENIRESLKIALELEGFTVHTASNGLEALEVLEKLCKHPCLVLCDLRMPLMTGEEFIEYVKKDPDRKTIPIVILSAAAESKAVKQAEGFIRKPFDLDLVIEKIKEFCQENSDNDHQCAI